MRIVFCCLIGLLVAPLAAQRPHQSSAAEIHQSLRKLRVLGNVLYLAAHPDDENTRFIAYSANERLFDTAYLSLTRGDGGQNLIGPELREELGIIRTQELLAARRTDGGIQYFSRANDFGYSKTAEETLEIWDKDKILSDVVRVIREFRPDVIVCRFPTTGGGGHGHHTASALLGLEAFGLSADPEVYPEQIEQYGTWQAKRIVVNTGRWWNSEISADDPGVVVEDIGAYNQVLGTSYNEMAARSRTMHKSQGFGATGRRGEHLEYFEHLAGDEATDSLFDGIQTGWGRVPAGSPEQEALVAKIDTRTQKLIEAFDLGDPTSSLPDLVSLYSDLYKLEEGFWKKRKVEEVKRLIRDCAGLYIEATADDYWAAPGSTVDVTVELTPRGAKDVRWMGYWTFGADAGSHEEVDLERNIATEHTFQITLPETTEPSIPYWLKSPGTLGTYQVDNLELVGTPENDPAIAVRIYVRVQGHNLSFVVPLVYKWNDPVHGEQYRPFVVCPPAFVNFSEASFVFADGGSKEIELSVKSVQPGFRGNLEIQVADGWQASQTQWPIELEGKGSEQSVKVVLTPGPGATSFDMRAVLSSGGQDYDLSLRNIDYDHIPNQVYMPKAIARMVYVDIERRGERIGYLAGAGDSIPKALRNVGYRVDELSESDLTPDNLRRYDAIITGIRLLNVDDRVGFYMPKLMEYCEAGGTLVLQYNTRHALKTDSFAPYPLTLSRDRVTEEDSEVRFLMPDHPVLNVPNRITQEDFLGWVQERGLYFPNTWDEQYDAILSWNDQGEEAKDGSLLVAKYGEGFYVYSGISFFRELPAGVPGAYRLLVNLLSLGNE